MNYGELTFHELRKECKEQEIKFKLTDKKADLITMLKAGKTVHKDKPKVSMPKLEPAKVKAKPSLPEGIMPLLEELKKRGLTWVIDEHECTVTFKRDLEVCANLDQSENNIYNSARAAFGRMTPIQTGVYGRGDVFNGFNG